MNLGKELEQCWQFVKAEFSKKFAEQIANELLEITNDKDLRIIKRTIAAKGKTVAQKTAVRIFKRMIKFTVSAFVKKKTKPGIKSMTGEI